MRLQTKHWSGLPSSEGLTRGGGSAPNGLFTWLLAKGLRSYLLWQEAPVSHQVRVSDHLSIGCLECSHHMAVSFLPKKEKATMAP